MQQAFGTGTLRLHFKRPKNQQERTPLYFFKSFANFLLLTFLLEVCGKVHLVESFLTRLQQWQGRTKKKKKKKKMRSSHDHIAVPPRSQQLYCQEHVFVFSPLNNDQTAGGVWIPGFLALFSTDVPRLCWTSYERVRASGGSKGGQRLNPLQVNEVPERPASLEQFTLKLALAQIHSLWKHTPEVGRGVPVVRVTLDDANVRLCCVFFFSPAVF
jgi:hypothetical protein